jgi:diguanylate cyclase (GGDEF)-like protein/PAS domain S-box-containing protein
MRYTWNDLYIDTCIRMKKSLSQEYKTTDREVKNAELLRTLDIYRNLVEATTDSIYMVDRQCRYMYVNPRHCLRLGLPQEDLVGSCYKDFHSPEATIDFIKNVAEVFKKGLSFQREHYSLRDGNEFLRTFSPVRTAASGEEVIAVAVISKNVTEWKRAEHLYATLAEKSPIGIFIIQDDHFQWVNPRFEESVGYKAHEILGLPSLSFVHADDRQLVRMRAVAMLRGENILPYEYRIITKKKDILWYMETVTSINFNGRRATLGNQMDITRQKMAEDALRQSEERSHTILDTIADAYYETDLAGNTLMFNDAYLKLLGYTNEETQGINYRQYVDKKSANIAFRIFHQVFKTGKPVKKIEWEINTKKGEKKNMELSVTLVRDVHGKPQGFRGIISDITERHKMDEMIRQQAFYDYLTALPNRTLFYDRLHMGIKRARRDKKMIAVIILDLDRFKEVNDNWGHATGDALLRAVAQRLQEMVRDTDTIARYGGDEFTFILPSINRKEDALLIARKIIKSFKEPFQLAVCNLAVTSSLGMAIYPTHSDDIDTLMKKADTAMYRAKARGRNRFCCCSNLA